MIRGMLIAVLILGVAGTAYWGYQEHREKNTLLLNAENNYQRAFHDLSYRMDLLHDKLGTTLAMNSRQSLSPALTEVWRITSQAHNDVGQLPLALLSFNKTEEFLGKMGNFSFQTAVRDLDKKPLSKQEYTTLTALYKQSGDIQNELRSVQYKVLKNHLSWMDVAEALASGKQLGDNTIIDGFKTVENTVSGYAETNMGPTFTNMEANDENFNKIQGKTITEQEAVQISKKYSGFGSSSLVQVTGNGKGSVYGFYSVSLKNPQTKEEAGMDITKKGGYPIWYINSRNVKKQAISLYDGGKHAATFLQKAGFPDMELLESNQYDNIGIFDFVTHQNHIRIYPESIKVKVALDNGAIIGFSAQDYLKSHYKRNLSVPAISIEQAKKKINPNLKIMDEREAVIMNTVNQEVLCYEFLGVLGEDTYRIFINAKSGKEEEVQKLKSSEPAYEGAV